MTNQCPPGYPPNPYGPSPPGFPPYPPNPNQPQPGNRAYRPWSAVAGGASILLERGQKRQVVMLNGGWDDATIATVGFAVLEETFEPGGTAYRSNILAEVAAGVGGGRMVAELDVRTGVQITLPASSLAVNVYFAEDPGAPIVDTPLSVRVAACLCGDARPARAFNTRSYPQRVVEPGSPARFPVPPYGFALQLVGDPGVFVPGSVTVAVQGASATAGYVGGQTMLLLDGAAFGSALLTEGIKLPNAARVVTVTSASGVPLEVGAVFALSL